MGIERRNCSRPAKHPATPGRTASSTSSLAAPGDHQKAQETLAACAASHLAAPEGVLTVDETGHEKVPERLRPSRTPIFLSEAREYWIQNSGAVDNSATLGRIGLRQVAVHPTYATRQDRAISAGRTNAQISQLCTGCERLCSCTDYRAERRQCARPAQLPPVTQRQPSCSRHGAGHRSPSIGRVSRE